MSSQRAAVIGMAFISVALVAFFGVAMITSG
jgi:hypothetical protein